MERLREGRLRGERGRDLLRDHGLARRGVELDGDLHLVVGGDARCVAVRGAERDQVLAAHRPDARAVRVARHGHDDGGALPGAQLVEGLRRHGEAGGIDAGLHDAGAEGGHGGSSASGRGAGSSRWTRG